MVLEVFVSSYHALVLPYVKCGNSGWNLSLWVGQIDEKMQTMFTNLTWQVPDIRKTTTWAYPSDCISKL